MLTRGGRGRKAGGGFPWRWGTAPGTRSKRAAPRRGVRPRRAYAAARIAAAFTSSLTAPAKVSKFASKRACRSRAVRS